MNNHEKIWSEYDARLSVVQRWGIAPTIQKQSVAEHCFNVERIAIRIAKEWFDIGGPTTGDGWKWEIVKWAHHHDDLEALMGDPPTMSKPYFLEKEMAEDHQDLIPLREPLNAEIKAIVKLADLLEGFRFLCMERALGNYFLDAHWENYFTGVENHIRASWPDKVSFVWTRAHSFMGYLSAMKSKRESRRGR